METNFINKYTSSILHLLKLTVWNVFAISWNIGVIVLHFLKNIFNKKYYWFAPRGKKINYYQLIYICTCIFYTCC